jgi:hypothetical protein
VSAFAERPHLDPEVAVAATLDDGAGGFTENGEVALEQVGTDAGETPESIQALRDLLVVVPDPGEVDRRVRQFGRQLQLHRDPRLHVDGAATPELVAHDARRKVVVDRHGVEMAGDHDTTFAPKGGARDDGVAVPEQFEMRDPGKRGLDRVGDRLLVARHRFQVAQRPRQLDRGRRKIERGR